MKNNNLIQSKTHNYDDIINLPHHISQKHPHMSIYDRAAQFSPFAALTGYENIVKEAGRVTSDRIELDDCRKEELSRTLLYIKELLSTADSDIEISVTYYVPDAKKNGGCYETHTGFVKKIDEYSGNIIFSDLSIISINDIIDIELRLR